MTQDIAHSLRKVKQLAQETYHAPCRILLFGSYVKNSVTKNSDIDIAVIVPNIQDRFEEEIAFRKATLDIDDRISPFLFTYKELQEPSPLTQEIKNNSVEIH